MVNNAEIWGEGEREQDVSPYQQNKKEKNLGYLYKEYRKIGKMAQNIRMLRYGKQCRGMRKRRMKGG